MLHLFQNFSSIKFFLGFPFYLERPNIFLGDQSLSTKFGYKLSKQINMTIYFEILIIELQVLYVFKKHVKFHVNRMLFIIQSINLKFRYSINQMLF